jgi:hypothetical protein
MAWFYFDQRQHTDFPGLMFTAEFIHENKTKTQSALWQLNTSKLK